jgi:protoporphyrinogen oxidase
MQGPVVIIGAGPAGLTAAYHLASCRDVETLLLERDAAAGGRVRTRTLPEGFVADDSAQFFAGNYRRTMKLMRQLGIHDQLEEVNPDTFSALYRDGSLHPLPAHAAGLAMTKTFGATEKLAMLRFALACAIRYRRDAYVRPSVLSACDDVRLSDFVRRKFGARILDEVVDPLVAMSMSHADELSLSYGVSMAPIALSRHYVFPKGNGTFTQSLAASCSEIRLGETARAIVVEESRVVGVELEEDGSLLPAEVVVCATSAPDAVSLLGGFSTEAKSFLAGVPYSTCVQVLFGTEVPYLPCWGVAIPRSLGSPLTYVTEETYKSRSRAPAGAGLTQAFAIGSHARALLALEDGVIADRVWNEIQRLLPDYPDRLFSLVIRRDCAMVASSPGYQRDLSRFNLEISKVEGLHVIGDYQTNPLIEGSVYLGERTAQRVLAALAG